MKKFHVFNILKVAVVIAAYSCIACADSSSTAELASDGIWHIGYDNTEISLDDKIEVDKIIPLEETENSLIRFVDKCVMTSAYIFVEDRGSKCILVFDNEGHFLYKIDSYGLGAMEYSNLKDFCLSPDGESLYILDETSILKYEVKTGTAVDRLSLNSESSQSMYSIESFPENDEFLLWSNETPSCLYHYEDGDVKKVADLKGYGFIVPRFYRDAENGMNMVPNYGSFDVMRIDESMTFQKDITLDFGEYTLPENLIPKNGTEQMECDNQPYFKCVTAALETGKWVYYQTVGPELRYYHLFLNKEDGTRYSGYNNPEFPLMPVCVDKTGFWGVNYQKISSGKGLVGSLVTEKVGNDFENPVLYKFHFK